jgi:hypothetical protein
MARYLARRTAIEQDDAESAYALVTVTNDLGQRS